MDALMLSQPSTLPLDRMDPTRSDRRQQSRNVTDGDFSREGLFRQLLAAQATVALKSLSRNVVPLTPSLNHDFLIRDCHNLAVDPLCSVTPMCPFL